MMLNYQHINIIKEWNYGRDFYLTNILVKEKMVKLDD
jgi:hypothetical protein